MGVSQEVFGLIFGPFASHNLHFATVTYFFVARDIPGVLGV